MKIIKAKFDIGDKVFCLYKDEIVKKKIRSIRITQDIKQSQHIIEYCLGGIKIKKGEELEANVPYLFECPFCGEENRANEGGKMNNKNKIIEIIEDSVNLSEEQKNNINHDLIEYLGKSIPKFFKGRGIGKNVVYSSHRGKNTVLSRKRIRKNLVNALIEHIINDGQKNINII